MKSYPFVNKATAFSLRILDSFLYDMSSTDPQLMAAVASVLAAAALVASLLPATRAASVDPIAALRESTSAA